MYSLVDLHMHIVPGVDDGSRSIEESLKMLKLSEQQGVTDVFCTSHNGYSIEDGDKYLKNFNNLREAAKAEKINIVLHKGCEILCAEEYMDDILYGIESGAFSTLGNSNLVLVELYPDARPSEALNIVGILKKSGYRPVIAHMERNYNITGLMVNMLIMCGALIQVNACSFVDEEKVVTMARAKELLENKYIHFIGSDAHRIDHRPPDMISGINYVLEHSNYEYAKEILHGNFEDLFFLDNFITR